MDIVLAETFLAIREEGTYAAAAQRLSITQSTVSARVRKLEDILGQPVFVRGRHGAVTTTAGERFAAAAEALIRLWAKSRVEISAAPGTDTRLTIAAPQSLTAHLAQSWLPLAIQAMSRTAFLIDSIGADRIRQTIRRGELDGAVMFSPPGDPAFESYDLVQANLHLVRIDSPTGGEVDDLSISWIAISRDGLGQSLLPAARLAFNTGATALDYMLANGGRAFLPDFLIDAAVRQGASVMFDTSLPPVPNPVRVVLRRDLDDALKQVVVATLRQSFRRPSPSASEPAPPAG